MQRLWDNARLLKVGCVLLLLLFVGCKPESVTGLDPNTEQLFRELGVEDLTSETMISFVKEPEVSKLEALLDKGVKINAQTRSRYTPLMTAVLLEEPQLVELFLRRGADVNIEGSFHTTALMLAAQANNTGLIETLIKHGANIEAKDQAGMTALMQAASLAGKTAAVRTLLRHHPNLYVRDNAGRTALDYAKKYNLAEVIALLQKADAKE